MDMCLVIRLSTLLVRAPTMVFFFFLLYVIHYRCELYNQSAGKKYAQLNVVSLCFWVFEIDENDISLERSLSVQTDFNRQDILMMFVVVVGFFYIHEYKMKN